MATAYTKIERVEFLIQDEVTICNIFYTSTEPGTQKDLEFNFGYTHYNWMYRLTRDEKYLEEQKEYVKKYEARKTTGGL